MVASQEDHVGEPFSSFLPYAASCAIIVPDDTPPSEQSRGKLTLLIRPRQKAGNSPLLLNGILREIHDSTGRLLINFPVKLPAFSETVTGFWSRLPERPSMHGDVHATSIHFYNHMLTEVPEFKKAVRAAARGQIVVAGFVYSDEVEWQANSDDWFFLTAQILSPAKRSQDAAVRLNFIRADWGGEKALTQRAPALRPLRNKSVLQIGLGSLGSPVSLHLARAGLGQLHLVEYDELQVGNTIRWALGWQYVGFHKAHALAGYVAQEYPYTQVHPHHVRIGAPYPPNTPSDYQIIRELAERTDLIIDSAASHRVSHFLADLAKELGKPYLWLTTTHGAAGGVVGRILPDRPRGGCWHCFQHGLADKSIRLPADTGPEEVQPGGCSQRTFIGAGIDSDEIALLAARLAVATLSRNEQSGYPDFAWDIAVADLTRNELSIAPDWTSYASVKNSACRTCNSQ